MGLFDKYGIKKLDGKPTSSGQSVRPLIRVVPVPPPPAGGSVAPAKTIVPVPVPVQPAKIQAIPPPAPMPVVPPPVQGGQQLKPLPSAPAPGRVHNALQRDLSQLLMDDHYARITLKGVMKRLGIKEADVARKRTDLIEIRKLKEMDDKRIKKLKDIMAQFGWPGRNLVGEAGAHDVWILVQHADGDLEFQKSCLRLLADAVAKKQADPRCLAYLTDRVRVGENQRQVYGTQLQNVNGELVPRPIEDQGKVDERRRGVGLTPLAEYLRSARESLKNKQRR